jgi:hypothetical protein
MLHIRQFSLFYCRFLSLRELTQNGDSYGINNISEEERFSFPRTGPIHYQHRYKERETWYVEGWNGGTSFLNEK